MVQHVLARSSLRSSLLWLLAIVAVLGWLLTAGAVLHRIGTPFPGFLTEPNLLVSTLRPVGWTGTRAGLTSYERLVSANGSPLSTRQELDRLVESVPVGTPITYETIREGQRLELTIPTQRFGWPEVQASFLSPLLSGAAFLLIGIGAFRLSPDHPAARAHLLLSVAFGAFNAALFWWLSDTRFAFPMLGVVMLLGSTVLHLALTFPSPVAALRRHPWLVVAPYAPALAAPLVSLGWYQPMGSAAAPGSYAYYQGFLIVFSAWIVVAIAGIMGRLAVAAYRAPARLARAQARLVLFAAAGAFLPQLFIYLLPMLAGEGSAIVSWMITLGLIGFHLFPLTVAYAIVRHQLFDIHRVLRRTTLYLTLTLGLAGLYSLSAGLAYSLLDALLPIAPGATLPGFLAAMSVALAFRPLHDRLRSAIDRVFLGDRLDALRLLAAFEPGPHPDTTELAQRLIDLLKTTLAPCWIRLEVGGRLLAAAGEARHEQAALAIPIAGTDRLVLGPKVSEQPYSSEERRLLEALAAQAAIAFQQARLFEEQLELRIHEGVARDLAAERGAVLYRVIRHLRSDLAGIAEATTHAEQEGDVERLEPVHAHLRRIDALLNRKTLWLKGAPAPPEQQPEAPRP